MAKKPEKLTCFFSKPNSEVYLLEEAGSLKFAGYAAMYGTYSEDLGGFKTTIAKGAFDKVLQATDCRLLINHDPNLIFGRTKSGTLRLFADDKGLRFEGDPPKSVLTDHYAEEIRRGDMDGCSFTCDIDVDKWDFSGETVIRTLLSIGRLYDVGPVTYPAFVDTSVTVSHSLEAARAAYMATNLRPWADLMRLRLALAR